jgi:hypothetical protein
MLELTDTCVAPTTEDSSDVCCLSPSIGTRTEDVVHAESTVRTSRGVGSAHRTSVMLRFQKTLEFRQPESVSGPQLVLSRQLRVFRSPRSASLSGSSSPTGGFSTRGAGCPDLVLFGRSTRTAPVSSTESVLRGNFFTATARACVHTSAEQLSPSKSRADLSAVEEQLEAAGL